MRKTTHHVQINGGSHHLPNARNEEQEQTLETKSGSYLTPQHERSNVEDRNQPIDEAPEMNKDPLNPDYPLEGHNVS
jgi:hypothetical protein